MKYRFATALFAFVLVFSALIFVSTSHADSPESQPIQAASPAASPALTTHAAIRTTLATGQPAGASGQTLELVRYDIPAGTTLAVHIHPGMQIATVVSGELTYHVLKGEIAIGRVANRTATGPGETELLSAGESTVLYPGDWVVEVQGAVHYGENLGTEPVVLLASTLLVTGEPAAIPVNPEGTPVS